MELMSYEEYDDFEDYIEEDDDDLEAMLAMGMLLDEEAHNYRKRSGGCLTTVLMFAVISIAVFLMIAKG